MKKLIALLLVLVMVLGLAACGKKAAEPAVTEAQEDGNNPLALDPAPVEEEPDPYSFTFTQYGNGKIQIVGAEFTQSDYGDDLLRIYFDYTNQDGPGVYHYLSNELEFFSITQDGKDCERYLAYSSNDFIVPEDLNFETYLQPGCTNRNTILIECDPNGGNVKVSCYLTVGSLIYDPDEVEPFEFEIDTKNLMGVPEPFVLPAITDPQYTAGMSASGVLDYPMDSEVSIDGIELTKDYDGKDVLRVKLTVTNNGDEPLIPALLCYMTLYQDGVSLPEVVTWDLYDEDVTAEDEAFQEDLYPGETVQCSALFYPRNQSPVEAVCENLTQSDLRVGTCFDVKSLFDGAKAEAEAAAEAAAAAMAAASAADKELMKQMVGAWDRTNSWPDHITFNADGTGVHDMTGDLFDFTYIVTEGVVYLTYDDGEETDYEISVSGNDLVLTNTFYQEEQTFARAGAEETEEEQPEVTEAPTEESQEVALKDFIIGTWVEHTSGYEETFTFNADGTGVYYYTDGATREFSFTYVINDTYVYISYDDGNIGGFDTEIVDDNTIMAEITGYGTIEYVRE